MNAWKPSAQYNKVAEANREFYAQIAQEYDTTETCVVDTAAQAKLDADLEQALDLIGKPRAEIHALDACGGSGNISIKLLKKGVDVILADISPELQQIFRKKCEQAGLKPQCVCSEIGAFLASHDRQFDLIVFSSALHHLEDIDTILGLAFQRLAPNGVIFTAFDPASRERLSLVSRGLLFTDYLCFKIIHQTGDFPKAIGRRLGRMFSGATANNKLNTEINASTVGMLAEYHVEKGIDDLALVARLKKMGFEIVRHDRWAGARFALSTALLKRIGGVTSFQLVLRKPA